MVPLASFTGSAALADAFSGSTLALLLLFFWKARAYSELLRELDARFRDLMDARRKSDELILAEIKRMIDER